MLFFPLCKVSFFVETYRVSFQHIKWLINTLVSGHCYLKIESTYKIVYNGDIQADLIEELMHSILNAIPDIYHTEGIIFILHYIFRKKKLWEIKERFLKSEICEKKTQDAVKCWLTVTKGLQ